MNIQAMMKQAQKMQNDMMIEKNKIDEMEFEGTSSFVTVKLKGTKKLMNVKIEKESLDSDEIEMLEDMITIAINEALKNIDKEVENKLGKYTKGMPGLF